MSRSWSCSPSSFGSSEGAHSRILSEYSRPLRLSARERGRLARCGRSNRGGSGPEGRRPTSMMTTGSSITNARSCDRGGEWPYSPFAAQAAVRRGVPFRHCIHGRIDRGRRITTLQLQRLTSEEAPPKRLRPRPSPPHPPFVAPSTFGARAIHACVPGAARLGADAARLIASGRTPSDRPPRRRRCREGKGRVFLN